MKKIAYLFSVGALFSLFTFIGCGDDDGGDVDPVQEQINRLAKTWNATTVLYNPPTADRTVDYQNFSLTFNGSAKTYSANNPDNVPGAFEEFSGGDWDFGESNGEPNIRNILLNPSTVGPLSIEILDLSDTELEIRFIYNQGQAGRVKAVDGEWEMTFTAAN